jgi:UDP-N-acetylmuramoyl-L-alanyl-D-glutamate--2,6-diaminopimelate ligase
MYREAEGEKISCSVKEATADFFADKISLNGICGVSFNLKYKGKKTELKSEIPGEFTVSNALLAAAVLKEAGLTEKQISSGIASLKGVRGRMERLPIEKDFSVFIDFAHTPDALAKLLESVRRFKRSEQRIVTLFGCGGDRDPSKRSLMGAIASRLSDFVIITGDNSRSENPKSIIDEIMTGFDKKCPYKRIDDRREAIIYAVENADKGDIILLCGKGHEEYEIDINGQHPFSERDIVYSVVNKKNS